MDRGAWWATVQGVAEELDTTERRSTARHLADSLCGSPEAILTLLTGYTPVQKS